MRYLLFGGDKYYPLGGWQDYKAGFDDLVRALEVAAGNTYTAATGRTAVRDWEWWQIVDLETGRIVKEGTSDVYESKRDPDREE